MAALTSPSSCGWDWIPNKLFFFSRTWGNVWWKAWLIGMSQEADGASCIQSTSKLLLVPLRQANAVLIAKRSRDMWRLFVLISWSLKGVWKSWGNMAMMRRVLHPRNPLEESEGLDDEGWQGSMQPVLCFNRKSQVCIRTMCSQHSA